MEIPAVEVPVQDEVPVKVDVMFLLDDSVFITRVRARAEPRRCRCGAILGEDVTPLRIKTRRGAAGLRRRRPDDLLAGSSRTTAVTPSDYDLAFGVSRFEDYADLRALGPRSSSPAERPSRRAARSTCPSRSAPSSSTSRSSARATSSSTPVRPGARSARRRVTAAKTPRTRSPRSRPSTSSRRAPASTGTTTAAPRAAAWPARCATQTAPALR